jgi:hypothetical protein
MGSHPRVASSGGLLRRRRFRQRCGLSEDQRHASRPGAFTRPAAVAIFIFVMAAVVPVPLPSGFLWIDKGLEYPLVWGVAALSS